MPTLLTFGDSNTHGTPPMPSHDFIGRHPAGVRWPTVTHAALGPEWNLVEEGLPGRMTKFDDLLMGPVMNGWLGLRIALKTHRPIDVLTIMLGTNDTKCEVAGSAEEIAAGLAGLLGIAFAPENQAAHSGYKVLVIAPPPVVEVGPFAATFAGAAAKSAALAPLYQDLAHAWGAGFLDAGQHIAVSPIDGVHFDEAAHQTLGQVVATAVADL